jgi:hypothetical protein
VTTAVVVVNGTVVVGATVVTVVGTLVIAVATIVVVVAGDVVAVIATVVADLLAPVAVSQPTKATMGSVPRRAAVRMLRRRQGMSSLSALNDRFWRSFARAGRRRGTRTASTARGRCYSGRLRTTLSAPVSAARPNTSYASMKSSRAK